MTAYVKPSPSWVTIHEYSIHLVVMVANFLSSFAYLRIILNGLVRFSFENIFAVAQKMIAYSC